MCSRNGGNNVVPTLLEASDLQETGEFILCEAIRGGTGLEVALPWGPGLSVEGVSLCPTTHSQWRGLHLLPV